MVAILLPVVLALVLAVGGTVVCWFVFRSMALRKTPHWRTLSVAFETVGIEKTVGSVMTVVLGGMSAAWFLATIVMAMGTLGVLLSYPLVGVGLWAVRFYVTFKSNQRRAKFLDQLEMALRLISGGIRVGLSLPQAMTNITTEMEDPARMEFYRVIGQTRIGVSTADAMEDLSDRMPSGETKMLARVIRVQAQTGGSLSTILDHLAETIKDRRRIARKISALTAEGRMGALVLEALPLGVGFFILVTQQTMSQALLHTLIGHLVIGLVLTLEVLAVWSLNKMLQVNV